jgi:hypothetical protein|tara:strand:+ start:12051 stop:12809 length:759 start_codon:yes stop_codon:yes gene_type:complete
MNPETGQEIKDAKSAKKFMWILMLIPIGLGLGVVLSNINFRKKEAAKTDIAQYRASQIFDKDSFQDDMAKIFLSQDENTDYFLRHISSTLGINNYLTILPTQGYSSNLGYYDIKGEDEKIITVVVIELDESNAVARSSLLAISTAVIKSLAGEKRFPNTLRFVFLPKEHDGNRRNLMQKDEELEAVFNLRAGGGFSLNDKINWRATENIWQHPAMAYPHESVSDRITPGQVELSLQAAKQLKMMLQKEMQNK